MNLQKLAHLSNVQVESQCNPQYFEILFQNFFILSNISISLLKHCHLQGVQEYWNCKN